MLQKGRRRCEARRKLPEGCPSLFSQFNTPESETIGHVLPNITQALYVGDIAAALTLKREIIKVVSATKSAIVPLWVSCSA